LGCGQLRHVRYIDAERKGGPACWTCTHGIRPDEPHRVYLFRFPVLGVPKIGITHNRHDSRLDDHMVNGGILIDSVVAPDRKAALAVEAWVLPEAHLCLYGGVSAACQVGQLSKQLCERTRGKEW
jgi:hypothetical protein